MHGLQDAVAVARYLLKFEEQIWRFWTGSATRIISVHVDTFSDKGKMNLL